MRFRLINMLFIFVTFAAHAETRSPLVVRYPSSGSELDTRDDYDLAVIDLALKKSEKEFGPYDLIPSVPMAQSRALDKLKEGQLVDVVATTTTKERERDLLPIRHSIHKDLMGIKLFLIRKEDQPKFSRVRTLEDLGRLVAGQGHDWPDVFILRTNGLLVSTGTNYDGLFRMLEKKRFDYFPRALPEVYDEQLAHAKQGLVVEQTLALTYPLPAYIFVNKTNTTLAKRLEKGFENALRDGSFQKLFLRKHGDSIAKAKLDKRRIFNLQNPLNPNANAKVSLKFFD